MWTMSMDMSRDECIKCLRCLELDAYGNMVSVLRAQGPFTEDKKRLLDELAKVLHISNERHRAEVRRAVNDEKLSFIAEQLNGPNTWTDWAIEGRRTIPLLPRLEARTAFTELANSLSLVIAAANEKKAPVNEKHTESILNSNKIIKNETDSFKESNIEENLPPKNILSNPPRSTRGRKRKRPPDSIDITANSKIYPNNKVSKIDDNDEISYHHQNIPSPLPNNWLRKISEKDSVTCTETTVKDSINEADYVSDNVCSVSVNNKYRNYSTSSKYLKNNSDTIPQTNITAIDVKLDTYLQPDYRIDIPNNDTEVFNNQITRKQLNNPNVISSENTQSNSMKIIEKLPNVSQCRPTNSIVSNTKQETIINSIDKVVSSGPGPPIQINSPVMAYKKLPRENFNHQSMTKEIKVNSNNTIDVNTFTNSKFSNKGNVIVVQKVPSQSVTISRAGKEVLGKVIMDSKNLYLNKTETTSLTLLPHKSLSNNSDQIVNLMPMLNVNSSHVEVVKSNVNSSNIVMFDIQQDVPEKTNSLTISHTNSEIAVNSNTKTVPSDMDTDHIIEDYHEERLSPSPENLDIIFTDTNASCEENETNDTCLEDGLEIQSLENPIKRDSSYNEIVMIAESDADEEQQEILDVQTEIYNFETNENVCEIQIEETIPETTVQPYPTSLNSANIHMEDYNYIETEEETVIIQADEEEIITSMGEELNEIHHSE
ncbi:BRCA2-interacting transcriptional repressor EMSY isoform X2 [Chelonus insularis]|uniref:BRCA2-interacting transcriptional repressor EMSY isoform X2 n=1 Tax=Chelonus insularis TaxID=460826 RepID=UPI00158E5EDE|nr:BRCA2-interacting transcriptional repressor EMSY isoform X2 [Chelonus insularis]